MKNKIAVLNLIIIFLFLFFLCEMNKYGVLTFHGYTYPYGIGWRHVAKIYETLLSSYLPSLFYMHPNDFRAGFNLGSIIISSLYIAICFLFAKGFFISSKNQECIIKRKELLLIFPLSFLLIFINEEAIGYNYIDIYMAIYRTSDLATASEYFYLLIFSIPFIYAFYNILFKENKPNNFILLFYILLSFIMGYYNELTNLTSLFFIIFLLLFVYIFDKQKLKNKYLLFLIVPFLLSFFYFYLIGKECSDSFVSYHSNLSECITYFLAHYKIILYKFVKAMFFDKIVLFSIILFLSLLLIKYKNVLSFVYAILFGYILTNFLSVFSIFDSTDYLFLRDFWNSLYTSILHLIILILLGTFYEEKNIKKITLGIIIISIFVMGINIPNHYKARINTSRTVKEIAYLMDKYSLVYSTFGESVILPANFLNTKYTIFSTFIAPLIHYEDKIQKNCYYNNFYIGYESYLKSIYHKQFIGFTVKDDEFALSEFNKRALLLNEKMETKKELFSKNIKFEPMYKKYRKYNLTLNDIEKMQEKYGPSDILDKAKAYIYYKNKDFNKALLLYNNYLEKNPDDIDAIINVFTIYKIKKEDKKAENIYNKLVQLNINDELKKILLDEDFLEKENKVIREKLRNKDENSKSKYKTGYNKSK